MRASVVLVASLSCGLLAGCGDRPAPPLAPHAGFAVVSASACLSGTAIDALIRQVFPSGGDRSAALSRFSQVERLLARGTSADTQSAQAKAIALVEFITRKYEAGRLIGGQSPTTQAALEQLLNAILCTAGLPDAFGTGSLGPNGAVAFIFPTTPDTTVVNPNLWAGVHLPAASVSQPSVVTITPLDDDAHPLLTAFDQYPLYYEFHVSPAVPFNQDVLVGVCQLASLALPAGVASRLRLGHNVAPYAFGSVDIAPYAAATFLDCTNAGLAVTPFRRLLNLASRVVGPTPLLAAPFATSGIGGTVRTFSPFGAVDTLGVMTASAPLVQLAFAGGLPDHAPSVRILTPAGRPIPGIAVTFAVTSGGGTVTGAHAVTDTSGVASATGWRVGSTGPSVVTATALAPPGTGITGNGITFQVTVLPH